MTDPLERIAAATESIARSLEELLELGRPHVDTLAAYQRGGKLAAWTASRRAARTDHAAGLAALESERDGNGNG
jgi:hypothetical protein